MNIYLKVMETSWNCIGKNVYEPCLSLRYHRLFSLNINTVYTYYKYFYKYKYFLMSSSSGIMGML